MDSYDVLLDGREYELARKRTWIQFCLGRGKFAGAGRAIQAYRGMPGTDNKLHRQFLAFVNEKLLRGQEASPQSRMEVVCSGLSETFDLKTLSPGVIFWNCFYSGGMQPYWKNWGVGRRLSAGLGRLSGGSGGKNNGMERIAAYQHILGSKGQPLAGFPVDLRLFFHKDMPYEILKVSWERRGDYVYWLVNGAGDEEEAKEALERFFAWPKEDVLDALFY